MPLNSTARRALLDASSDARRRVKVLRERRDRERATLAETQAAYEEAHAASVALDEALAGDQ